MAYLSKDELVDAFGLFITFVGEIIVDILEVGNKHKLNEVFILLQVKVFQ